MRNVCHGTCCESYRAKEITCYVGALRACLCGQPWSAPPCALNLLTLWKQLSLFSFETLHFLKYSNVDFYCYFSTGKAPCQNACSRNWSCCFQGILSLAPVRFPRSSERSKVRKRPGAVARRPRPQQHWASGQSRWQLLHGPFIFTPFTGLFWMQKEYCSWWSTSILYILESTEE